VRPEGLGQLMDSSYLIGSRIRDLPACSGVSQPLRYREQSHCRALGTSLVLERRKLRSELYRLSDRHLSANLVPTFAGRGVSCGQSGGSPTAVNLSFLDRSRYFSFK
jgi:hypothetical protein